MTIQTFFATGARKLAAAFVALACCIACVPVSAQTATPAPSELPTPQSFLVAQPVNFTIAAGNTQDVKILGATGTLTAAISAPIAQVTVDPTLPVVHVLAQQFGTATIHITDQNGASVDVLVRVAQPAGTIPSSIKVTVTGSPAGPQFLQRQVQSAFDRAIRPTLQPGAAVSYGTLAAGTQPLQPGTFRSTTIPVTVAGTDALATVNAVPTVNI
ncbi:MAG: hypothetical protein JO349_03020, partial [Candidatus Eremiobacteraeota bacterium]|nr:hypothetical protein [Candidatus Eremiobacteraeota bacterium]